MDVSAVSRRRAEPVDREVLVALIAAYYAYDHIAFDEASVREGLATFLGDDSLGRAYLLQLGTQPVGYALVTFGFDLEFGGRLATLTDLYLQPKLRRARIGSETLRFIAAECRELGVRALQLEVERTNVAAQALYHAFGFRPLTRLPMVKLL